MIFVIERMIDSYHEKMEAWQRACDKWVSEGGYRSERDYKNKYPRPYETAKAIIGNILVALIVAAVIIGAVFLVNAIVKSNKHHQKPHVAEITKPGGNCQKFNMDDHVRIQYGDYAGDTGKIIGGCRDREDYQVKIDPNMKADISGDGQDAIDVSGRTISVSSSDNLVVVKE